MTRATLRKRIQPIVGERAWQTATRLERRLLSYVGQRREARQKGREEELLRAAKVIQDQRAEEGLRAKSRDLTALAKHFRTDKWGHHRYTPHYQWHFARFRDKPVTLLEIGIGGYARAGDGGGSLRMWKQYFGRGKIYGLDIEDKSFVEEDRIRTFQGDQSDPVLLARIVDEIGSPDLIIDDGSHRPEHVLASFEVLFPLLADDGIYVVEDTQTSYWPEWGGAEDIHATSTSLAMLKRLTDGLNYEEFVVEPYEPTYTDLHVVGVTFYHNLVFVQKGRNAEGTQKRKILRRRYAEVPETG